MARRFNCPTFRMHYLENGMRALVIQAQHGETIEVEFDEKTAAKAAALLLDPHPGHHQEPRW